MSEQDLNNCFLDLQRAATAFYLKPQSQTPKIFLAHAHQILEKIRSGKWLKKVIELEKLITPPPQTKTEVVNLADRILTLGCLMKKV